LRRRQATGDALRTFVEPLPAAGVEGEDTANAQTLAAQAVGILAVVTRIAQPRGKPLAAANASRALDNTPLVVFISRCPGITCRERNIFCTEQTRACRDSFAKVPSFSSGPI
jgi:hypothetical protein